MKKILVTGHTGFIGSHLIDALEKYQVIGISNNIPEKQFVPLIQKDVRKITLKDIPKNIYGIVHLAAISDLEHCQKNPTECFEINVQGTQNMLEIARKINSKFLYLSTGHVYGVPKELPILENHPRNPTSIYSASKLAGEILCESYARSYGMNVSILRLFSVYGPKEPKYKVTSVLISQLLTKNVISIGNLYPKRDFVYVKDAVNAIEMVLRKSLGFNIYNVGSGKSHSILDLYNDLKKITGRKNPIKSIKSHSREHEIREIVSNSSKIRKLGWKPKTRLSEGLAMTLDWYKSKK